MRSKEDDVGELGFGAETHENVPMAKPMMLDSP
jgi:hypothetical protein